VSGEPLNDSRNGVHRAPAHRKEWGRFDVFRRMDGLFIVRDPMREIGRQTVGDPHKTLELADAAAMIESARATARGEPNERVLQGFKHDWNDPKTWERFG
jgi:hypothetical protein